MRRRRRVRSQNMFIIDKDGGRGGAAVPKTTHANDIFNYLKLFKSPLGTY